MVVRAPGDTSELPGWMTTIETVTAPRALLLGALMSGANPKNIAFTAAGTSSIAEVGLVGYQVAVAAVVFVLLGSVAVLGALIAHLVGGDSAALMIDRVKWFMLDYNVVIIMLIMLFFGVKLVGDGLGGLALR